MLEFAKAQLHFDVQLFESDLKQFLNTLPLHSSTFSVSDLVQSSIRENLLYHAEAALDAPGKRIRPLLAYWVFRNYVGDPKQVSEATRKTQSWPSKGVLTGIRQLAVATEVLHAASLVIDDIEDGSTERRGRAALYVTSGLPFALNAGSWIYFAVLKSLKERKVQQLALDMLYDCHVGQALDLGNKNPETVRKIFSSTEAERWEHYRVLARLKTARLMEFSIASALSLARVGREDCQKLTRAMERFGVAFQILDDLKNFSHEHSGVKVNEDLNAGLRNAVCLELVALLTSSEYDQAFHAFENGTFATFVLLNDKLPAAKINALMRTEALKVEARDIMKSLARDGLCDLYAYHLLEKPLLDMWSSLQEFLPPARQKSGVQ